MPTASSTLLLEPLYQAHSAINIVHAASVQGGGVQAALLEVARVRRGP
jgi:hypothetical protein